MEKLIPILKEFGPWGLLFVVLMQILLNGKLTFEYPYSGRQEVLNHNTSTIQSKHSRFLPTQGLE